MGRIVIDVCQFHSNCSGSWKPSKMATHVFSLEDYEVLILSFSVQIRDCCAQDSWAKENKRDEIQ